MPAVRHRIALIIAVALASGCSPDRGPLPPPAPVDAKSVPTAVRPAFDLYAGTWKLAVKWHGAIGHGANEWTGDMVIARTAVPGEYAGTMTLSCTSAEWVVVQDVAVKIQGGDMTIQGSNVREVKTPDGIGGYGFDIFHVHEADGQWVDGDATGQNATQGQVRVSKVNDPA
jgi:hypothetical protein